MKKTILLAVIALFLFNNNSFAQEEEKSEGFKGAWYGLEH